MQRLAQRQHQRNRHRAAHGDGLFAQHRVGAKQECGDSGDHGGCAQIADGFRFQPFKRAKHADEAQQRGTQHDFTRQRCQRACQPAEKADQGKGSKTGRALVVFDAARAPAAL